MSDGPPNPTRSYLLIPESMRGYHVQCGNCDRPITVGYPFVPVPRDITHPGHLEDGVPNIDALCVYCDQLPA